MTAVTPVLLIILDGVGCRDAAADNAISSAHKPNWDRLWRSYPHTRINASELYVGLPDGQMGNSEVGHLNIGAGRVVYQDLTRIDQTIKTGTFFTNPVLREAVEHAAGKTLHIMGLLSPGGVHSHEAHLMAMVQLAAQARVPQIIVHAFLDGRDTPPRSAAESLQKMSQHCARYPGCRIGSIIGRYYAMDRDSRWERVQHAYDLLVDGQAAFQSTSAEQALQDSYARGETDEFVQATCIVDPRSLEHYAMQDGDVVVFMNFRADRARALTQALTDPDFTAFNRKRWPKLSRFTCLTQYGIEFNALPVAFAPQTIKNSFGEVIATHGLRQLRIAETEKYAHVTYFFGGGVETPYPSEDRILVPSPKVATYDLKPEMSAFEVTDRLVEAIKSKDYHAIICNFANGDMVGHSGQLKAATRAVEVLDQCLGKIVEAQRAVGGEVLITADHGNAEMMYDHETGQPHTAHTLNPVPCLYVGRPAKLEEGGALQDIAPTLLHMMGLNQPQEMTGRSLLKFT